MSASSVKVKFVASDPKRGGLPVKRKQVQHACDACRKKKRRCIHAEDSADATASESVPGDQQAREVSSPAASPPPEARPIVMNGASAAAAIGLNANSSARRPSSLSQQRTPQGASISSPSESSKPQTRFVGDLNPEAMFMEAMGPESKNDSSQKYDVGIWLSSNNGISAAGAGSQFITSRPPQAMDRFLLPFVKEQCMTTMPPATDFTKLKAVYYQKIHPIFPVIPPSVITHDAESPTTIVLKQLVCLAASTDPSAARYLHLGSRGSGTLSPQEFSQTISSAVRATLETSLIADRVLHIRALTILSMYTQPTCAEEADLPAQLGGRAIHHIQTLGLHLLRYDAPNCDELESLFCAVWALDRLNAAQYGRPCVIHERDIGTNLAHCIRKQPPCFRLLLSVIQWLDHVIELYRPGPTAEASGSQKVAFMDLPVLEAMIVDAEALRVPSFLIATIETLYHAVIILSCRLHRPGTLPAASTLPPPSSNARRSLAADRIACAIPRDHLSPMPFVPYAMSLALSVEYRKMRHSRLPMFRARAMNAFRRNCEMLRNFGDYFWSARVVANLGERVMKEMERAATNLTKEATPPADGAAPPEPTETNATPVPNVLPWADLTAIDTASGLDNMVDFSMVDAVSGQDLFGHIDPSFNLTAVEDALEANLDIGLPLNWGEWGHFAT